ncbi:hypothetical protein ABIF38_006384 [Bradyrhizobium japonicum]|nr:hypothetical protein [Bradyrhizobium elkanii]WAX24315.1 hypothetical protein [Bradyrhizobium phage ppBeUSDA76-1]MCP1731308.1 hypothetical protein [Bradyrhizobium elkanii]MCS3575437.1 hypothetical protein [Bradyrhizobium elkanii]MCS3591872.1 hypothetical protein [Bradyrhizobium elkanii]MCS3621317.1 hypothetical protein [Bradyrhizobium elkanii]
MKPFLISTALVLAATSAGAQSSLSDAERAAIQKAREFCIEALGGRDRLNRRIFFGDTATTNALHAEVNECAMRQLPRYLPPASR